MHVNEIVDAYERGLITESEAVEQGMVDRIVEVYRKAGREPRSDRRAYPPRSMREARRAPAPIPARQQGQAARR